MNVSEISNVSSYQGQGSQVNTATVSQAPKVAPVSESVDNVKITSADPREKGNNKKDGEKESNQPSMSFLKNAVEKINSSTESCEAVYGFHDKTNRVTIKMVDKETKETIKEFPAEETLDLIAKAWELAGILVDEKR